MIHSTSHTMMTHYTSQILIDIITFFCYDRPKANNSQFIVKNKYRIWDLLGRF